VGRKKAAQKTNRQAVRDRERKVPMRMLPSMNARSSGRLRLMFKVRMTARNVRDGNGDSIHNDDQPDSGEGIRLSFIHYRY